MNKAIGLAMALKSKSMKASDGGVCKSCGGKIGMAHGGMVSEHETENMQPSGGYAEDWSEEKTPDWGGFKTSELEYGEPDEDDSEPKGYSEGGGVDEEYNPKSINDSDGDNDDLTYSPEVETASDDNEEDDNQDKFLKAYMIHSRLRGRKG